MPNFSTYTIIASILLLLGAGFLFIPLELTRREMFQAPEHWLPKAITITGQIVILFGFGFLTLGFMLLLGTKLNIF